MHRLATQKIVEHCRAHASGIGATYKHAQEILEDVIIELADQLESVSKPSEEFCPHCNPCRHSERITTLERDLEAARKAIAEARKFIGEQKPETETVGRTTYLKEDMQRVFRILNILDAAMQEDKPCPCCKGTGIKMEPMYRSTRECVEMLEEIEIGSWNLDAWQQDFIESIRDWVDAGKELTPKQREVLDRIYNGS